MKYIFKKKNIKLDYREIDKVYLNLDKGKILRTNNINDIPHADERRGGKIAYSEWAHVIGLFQSLFYFQLNNHVNNRILDIGSGAGLLAMASKPFIKPDGEYLGLDVMKKDTEFCQKHYSDPNTKFEHFDINNSKYAKDQNENLIPWGVNDNDFDLLSALSVWTHLKEDHAIFYFKEINRVLKKGGKAIITFFYLDEGYRKTLKKRVDEKGKFHGTNQLSWIFSESAYDSSHWFSPDWVKVPEDAIGIDEKALEILLKDTTLELVDYFPGNWKENVGFYFQDVLVFQKK